MKAKRLSLPIAAVLAAGALWFAWSAWRSDQFPSRKSRMGGDSNTPHGQNSNPTTAASVPSAAETGPAPGPTNRPMSGQMLRPPEPNRRFTDFTPEERVQFARQGHGPGG